MFSNNSHSTMTQAESVETLNSFLRNVYSKPGKQIGSASTVNNFLKDFGQIEVELHYEFSKTAYPDQPRTNLIPIEQALRSPMEENY